MKKRLFIILLIAFLPVLLFAQMRIVTNESIPTGYTQDGTVQGTTITIIKGMMEIVGEEIEIEINPWKRSYEIAKNNANTIIFTAGRNSEREGLFYFIGPVITRKHVLMKMKGSPIQINNNDDVVKGGYKIGSLSGDWRTSYFEDLGAIVVNNPTKEGSLKMLKGGRIDLWVSSDVEAIFVAEKLGMSINDLEIAYVFRESASWIMINNKTPEATFNKWDNAFKELQKGSFFDDAAKEWGVKLDVNMEYTKELGFVIK